MKHIAIVRHGKSSWADFGLDDKDRPLNKRGKRDAPKMARLLHSIDWRPDLFIASPSKRTKQTAKPFLKIFDFTSDQIDYNRSIYHGDPSDYADALSELDDELDYIVLFGHNPAITEIANLVSKEYIPNVPTCGILLIELKIQKWEDVSWYNGKLITSYFPKSV